MDKHSFTGGPRGKPGTDCPGSIMEAVSHPAPRSKRRLMLVAGLSVAATVVAVVAGLSWYHTPRRLLVVEPGVLYRSALLQPHNLERVLDRYGIRTVVSLLPPNTPSLEEQLSQQAEICKKAGVRRIQIPMNGDTPPTSGQLAQWLELLDSDQEHPILVHCKDGAIRSGMMSAVYQIEYKGVGNREVLAQLPTFGHDLDVRRREPVRQFILDYTPRSQRKR